MNYRNTYERLSPAVTQSFDIMLSLWNIDALRSVECFGSVNFFFRNFSFILCFTFLSIFSSFFSCSVSNPLDPHLNITTGMEYIPKSNK